MRSGPIIRVNPTELHVDDPDYWEKLYTRDGKWDKSPRWCAQFGTIEAEVFTASHDKHRARRATLNPFFSKQKVTAMEPVLRSLVERVCERIKDYKINLKPLPLRLVYTSLTIAATCEFTFGQSYGMLEMENWGESAAETTQQALKGVHWARLFPWLASIENFVPNWMVIWLASKNEETVGLAHILEDVDTIVQGERPKDRSQASKTSIDRPTIYDVILASTLPQSEKTARRFRNVAAELLSAGSDTSTQTLHVMTYHLLSNPAILERLRAEIRGVQPNPWDPVPLKQLEQLPYLTGCILEGLRLGYGVGQASPRSAPDRVIKYREWEIPPGTPVGMSAVYMHMNEKIFPNPEEYNPGRWLEKSERNRLDKYLVPFSKGSRMCLGINLAWAELYMIPAAIFTRFDLELYNVNFEDHVKTTQVNFFPQTRRPFEEFRVLVR
ncbi:MAG: hypothetical protein Q9227_003416 [Pyrenula ochraceoflavens]